MTPIQIVQGEDKNLVIRIVDKDTQEPYDLTGATIEARLPGVSGVLSKDLSSGISVVSALGGKIQIALSEVDTAALKADSLQDFEIEVTKAGQTSIVQFLKALTVVKKLFG